MNFQRQVNQILDREHRDTLSLLGRVEQALRQQPGAASGVEAGIQDLARALARLIEQDIGSHFGFEETELFPRMRAAGDGDLAELLLEEHVTIRQVAAQILPLLHQAAAGQLDPSGFAALKPGALEMVERLSSHIEKETMALLPLLEDLLDEELDRSLAFACAGA